MLSSFEKSQGDKIRSSFTNVEAVPFTDIERATLFKSQFAKDVDAVLLGFDELEKAQDNEELEKSIGSAIHKYVKKVGDRYFYDQERTVTPINDLRDYHAHKTGLDSFKNSLIGVPHSLHVREAYKKYNLQSQAFKEKYGHDHDSPEATHHLRMTVAGMLTHIDNKVRENQALRAQGGALSVEKAISYTQFTGLNAQERAQCARIKAMYTPIEKSTTTPWLNGVNDDPEPEKINDYNDVVVLDAAVDKEADVTVVKGEEDEQLRDFHGKGEFDADGLEEKTVAKGENELELDED